MKPNFHITVAKKRDILLAQIRARQLCRMLGFAPLEQARVVCLIFEMVSKRLDHGPVPLTFRVEDRHFQVVCAGPRPRAATGPRLAATQPALSIPLPPATMAIDDIFWAMDRIRHMSSPDLFAEIHQQNNDLLRALSELQQASSPAVSAGLRVHAA